MWKGMFLVSALGLYCGCGVAATVQGPALQYGAGQATTSAGPGGGVAAESADRALDGSLYLVSAPVMDGAGPSRAVPAPVPAAIWLFGSALVAMAGLARTRRSGRVE